MPNPLRQTFLLLILFLLSGCLQFDAQEITLHYDEKTDRLDALLVYRGLYSNDTLDRDLEQLASVQQTGEFAIWSNWPLKPKLVSARPLEKPFADHCEVENGTLFTTPTGLLCAYQLVRVNDVKGFLKKVNTAIAGLVATTILGKKLGPDQHEVDDDTRELLLEVTRGKLDVVRLDGSAIVVTLPCSDADHAWLMQAAGKELLPELGRALAQRLFDATAQGKPAAAEAAEGARATVIAADGDRQIAAPDTVIAAPRRQFELHMGALAEARLLFDNFWSLQRQPEQTVLTIGLPHRVDNTLRKAPTGLYQANLQPALETRKIAFEQGVPDQELLRRFGEFHGRPAVLPPALAELRAADAKK